MQKAVDAAGRGTASISQTISNLGGAVTTIFTPLSLAIGKTVHDSLDFGEALTNIQAVTGQSNSEIAALGDELLNLGENSRFGAQAVAESMYDVVGGVVDASSRMATLKAAIAAAEAGNTDLAGTTKALISIMNGYGFSADQASHVTDVLTQTVNKGVGEMGDFAAAFPDVAGQAHMLGISLDDLGGMMAYITTKGVSASQAGTQLGALMTAMTKPSDDLSNALASIGFQSGKAAVQQLGLFGAMRKLKDAGYNVDELVGRIEGMRGAIALTDDGAQSFLSTFNDGLDGLTEKTREIQNASPAAQLDFFNSAMQTLSITIGDTLAPALTRILQKILPIIDSVIAWVNKNPDLVAQIGLIVAALGTLGPILIAVGAALGAIGTIVGIILSPIGLIIAAIVGLYLAFRNNFQGIRDFLQPILDRIVSAFTYLKSVIFDGVAGGLKNLFVTFEDGSSVIGTFLEKLLGIDPTQAMAIGAGINDAFNSIVTFITGTVLPTLGSLADWFINTALPAIVTFVTTIVIPAIQTFFTWLGQAWTTIQPGLQAMADWFINTALPAIVAFVTGTVIPAIQTFFNWLGQAWTTIQPGLQALADWFINTALPAIVNFITNEVAPRVQEFINTLSTIWTTIQPGLQQLFDWFITTGLPAIRDFIVNEVIPHIQQFADTLTNIWAVVGPELQKLYDWFVTTGLPAIRNFIVNEVMPRVKDFADVLAGIWTVAGPLLQQAADWFTKTGLPAIQTALQWFNDHIIKPVSDALGGLFSGISNITSGVSSAVNSLTGPGTLLGNIGTTIGQAVQIGQSVLSGHDYPGAYANNQAYLVGTGAQPEAFIPSGGGGGMAIPNFDKVMAGLGNRPQGQGNGPTFTGPITVVANNAQEFVESLQQYVASRG